MSEQTYTQEQLDQAIAEAKKKWEQEILQPVIKERDELLKYKPKEKTPEQQEIEKLKAELMQQKVLNALKEAELEDFVEFLNIETEEELKIKIDKLSKILDDRKLKNSYKPEDHRQMDAYEQAAKNNDVTGMIHAKLSKLFN